MLLPVFILPLLLCASSANSCQRQRLLFAVNTCWVNNMTLLCFALRLTILPREEAVRKRKKREQDVLRLLEYISDPALKLFRRAWRIVLFELQHATALINAWFVAKSSGGEKCRVVDQSHLLTLLRAETHHIMGIKSLQKAGMQRAIFLNHKDQYFCE